MSNHTKISSGADFEKAVQTKGKYVLIHVHSGEVPARAEEYAAQHKSTCDAYSVDVASEPTLMDFFKLSKTPAALVYKDGERVKSVEGKDEAGMQEIGKLLA
ncbi:hypothetical protein LTR37_007526 [Vermiconidia calcicola]|uniref:Uncharacterized protein n=1 Tax=Vermiconidia calcicola TaxID=1690605 RepID=A0ACC3NDP3_9PEZI|nr:hypothetical protein LTR37_007526 [Vermiconidia calcicola]